MKHGDKAKRKASKASGKKASPTRSKTRPTSKSSKAPPSKAEKREAGSAVKKGGNGKGRGETVSFSNPAVASAFKRAIKKYPNTFRRLTD